ncbi:MAG: serine--tRNA ligase, partial [Acidobacteriaceae bacterium]|nr:serine--tRNA ligase [Acidobacteriaceae bacterium]
MHDLNLFRNNLAQVRDRLATRGYTLDVDAFQALDRRRRQCVTETEQLRSERNRATAEIGKLRKQNADTAEQQQQVRAIGERIAELEEQVGKLDTEFHDLLASVPNIPQETVPVGKDETSNVELRRWGTPRDFSFQPKPHWALGPELGILDLERAAKVAGSRFAVYWGIGARLER